MSHAPGTILHGIRTVEHLRERCRIDADTRCWHYGLAKGRNGQPSVSIVLDGVRKTTRGRQAAVSLAAGRHLTGGRSVPRACCRSDDCCNPQHTAWMTPAEYGAWVRKTGALKGLPAMQRAARAGALVKFAKLSADQVAEIRASAAPNKELAARYGVRPSTVWAARTHRSWRTGATNSDVFSMAA